MLALDYDLAQDVALSDDNIVKLVEYKTLLQASTEHDLKPLAESRNLKYPYISINISDDQELLKHPNMLFKDAIDLIKSEHLNNLSSDTFENVNATLFINKDKPFNVELKLGTENGNLLEALNK